MLLVFGANGQLGYDICSLASQSGIKFVPVGREVDITDFRKVKDVIIENSPNVVINCAAYNQVDRAEEDTRTAFFVNGFAPYFMAKICKEKGIKFVTISTDYVFDGRKGQPYIEDDKPNPISSYGLSKLLGEIFVRRVGGDFIIVRSGGLYGIWGSKVSGRNYRNFPERVIENLSSSLEMRVVVDRISAPTYTKELASTILHILYKFSGIIHIMNVGEISFYDFAVLVAEYMNLDKSKIKPINSSEIKEKAKRPKYSVLKSKLHLGIQLSSIKEALKKYIEERKNIMKKTTNLAK